MRIAALLVALAVAACSPSRGSTHATTTAVVTPREDLPGLANFARVSPVLYRGAQPNAVGFRTLKSMGVRTVINLRSAHSDRPMLTGLGMRYVEIPSLAWNPEHEVVAKVLAVVRDPANQPVFVHCQHGADRTGYTMASYRIVEEGWDHDSALRELERFGFHTIWGSIPTFISELDADAMRAKVTQTKPPAVETL